MLDQVGNPEDRFSRDAAHVKANIINTLKKIEPRHEKTQHFACAKTKTQISFAVTAKLISACVFAT